MTGECLAEAVQKLGPDRRPRIPAKKADLPVMNISSDDVMEAVALAFIVASLVFLGLVVQQFGRAANDASLASDAAIVAEVETLVIGYPDVWRRGCMGEELEPTEAVIFVHIHHAYVFQYLLRWLRERKGLDVSSAALSIENLAMNIYCNSDFARE